MRSIQLTAICPHAPKLAPLVLPAEARIRIEVLDAGRRPARAVADGISHGDVQAVEVAWSTGDEVELGFLAGHDFTSTLIRKILHA